MNKITKLSVLVFSVLLISFLSVLISCKKDPGIKNTFDDDVSKSILLQNIDDENYVDSIELIKLAQFYDIKISDKYVEVKTQTDMIALRDYVYSEIRKKDPKFEGKK